MTKQNSKRKASGAANKSASPALLSAVRNAKWDDQPTIPVGALKLNEARAYLGGLSVPTMHRLIHRGLLRPCRQVRHLIFPLSELDRFLAEGMK